MTNRSRRDRYRMLDGLQLCDLMSLQDAQRGVQWFAIENRPAHLEFRAKRSAMLESGADDEFGGETKDDEGREFERRRMTGPSS